MVVRLSYLSGRALAPQARCPGFIFLVTAGLFTFLCFASNKFSLIISLSRGPWMHTSQVSYFTYGTQITFTFHFTLHNGQYISQYSCPLAIRTYPPSNWWLKHELLIFNFNFKVACHGHKMGIVYIQCLLKVDVAFWLMSSYHPPFVLEQDIKSKICLYTK